MHLWSSCNRHTRNLTMVMTMMTVQWQTENVCCATVSEDGKKLCKELQYPVLLWHCSAFYTTYETFRTKLQLWKWHWCCIHYFLTFKWIYIKLRIILPVCGCNTIIELTVDFLITDWLLHSTSLQCKIVHYEPTIHRNGNAALKRLKRTWPIYYWLIFWLKWSF